jgi:hypothetical protein
MNTEIKVFKLLVASSTQYDFEVLACMLPV